MLWAGALMHTIVCINEPERVQMADSITERQRAISGWLQYVLKVTGFNLTKLAEIAEVSHSTISRNLNPKPGYRYVLSTTSIAKIVARTGVAAPAELIGKPAGADLIEPEALPLSHNEIPAELHIDHNGQTVWKLNTRAVELPPFGYMPGDMVLVDPTVTAKSGDVVCARVKSVPGEPGQTLWRVYDPPILMTHTLDPDIRRKPLTVDDDQVKIVGPIVKTLRRRVSRNAA